MSWFGTCIDIDDQKKHQTQLREALQARDTFLSVAGHELKTPLTSLGLQIDLLRRHFTPEVDSRLEARLSAMRRQMERVSLLVDRLLDVSRIATGRMQLEAGNEDFGVLVREVVSRFEGDAERSHTPILLSGPEHIPGKWDRIRLEQVVSNLISNALKFGEGRPIHLVVSADPATAQLSVQDAGIGIPQESLSRIFNRFERGVSDKHYGGLGLGLYVSREIVVAMGGTISVVSAPGEGARFTLSIPRTPVVEEPLYVH